MKYLKLSPVLYTHELDASIDFFVNQLEFHCAEHQPEWGWVQLVKDDVELMLSKPNAHVPFEKALFTGSFYIRMTGVEKFWLRIKDLVHVCYPLEAFEYGMREFAIYDPNGYVLQFGEPLS